MLTTAFRDTCLGSLGAYLGLIKAISNFRTPTITEADYTGYSATRPGVTWGSAADTSPVGGRQKASSGAVTFGQNTGASQDILAWGVWSAASGGTLQAIGMLDTDAPLVGTCDTGDLITAPAHGLQADQRVYALACPGAPLPTGLSEGTAYYVLSTGITTDAFKISTSSGGSAVDFTTSGAAMFIPYKAVAIGTNATPEFASGALIVQI